MAFCKRCGRVVLAGKAVHRECLQQMEEAERFRYVVSQLCGKGLTINGWASDGSPIPFEEMYRDAMDYAAKGREKGCEN